MTHLTCKKEAADIIVEQNKLKKQAFGWNNEGMPVHLLKHNRIV